MKIISIANQKGGVGKSTLAINLAHAFKDNLPTYLVDYDLQGSTSIVAEAGFTKLTLEQFEKLDLEKTEGIVIVDTPPYLNVNFKNIYRNSDLIIVPTKAAYFDIAATKWTIENILEVVATSKKKVTISLLLNMVRNSSSISSEAVDIVSEFGIPVLKTTLSERVAFVRSVMLENGIYSTQDKKAIAEFNALVKECLINLSK